MEDDNSHSAPDPGGPPSHLVPRKTPQQERSRALVDSILQAAARVLVERGAEFNTNLVAEAAGVSVGSIYQYFPNKDALLAALIERQAAAERGFIVESIRASRPQTIQAALEVVLDAAFAFRRLNPPLQQSLLELLDRIPQYPALRSEAAQTTLEFTQLLTPLVSDVRRPNLGRALFVVCNAVFSLTHRGILPRPKELGDEELRQEILDLVLPYLTESVALHSRSTPAHQKGL